MRSLTSLLRSDRRALTAILVVAALGRLVAVSVVGDRALVYEFETLTLNLLDGRGFAFYSQSAEGAVVQGHLDDPAQVFPSAYMPPAYPVFLWGLTAVVGTGPAGIVAVELVQVGLDLLACALLFLLGRRLFGRTVGLLSALGYALFPALVIVPAQISAVGLFVFLLTLFLWTLARAQEGDRPGRYALAGLVFGLGVLARAQFLLFLPAVWLAVGLVRGRAALVPVLVFTGVAALTLAPWTLRNADVLGVATPLTTSGGRNLWEAYGNAAVGTHSGYRHPALAPPKALTRALDAVPPTPRYEVAVDSVYRAFAVEALRADPARAARLAVRKLGLYWVYFGGEAIRYPGAQHPAFWLPWLLVLPCFGIGLVVALRRAPRRLAFPVLYLLGQTAVVTAFFVLPRYRLEVLPVVLLFAAQGVAWTWARFRVPAPDSSKP